MVTRTELEEIKTQLLTPTEPIYTLDDLHTILNHFNSRETEDELEAITISYAISLVENKIKIYEQYPFYADALLKQVYDESNN